MKILYVLDVAGDQVDVCPKCRYVTDQVVLYLRVSSQPGVLLNLAFSPDFQCKCAELEQANKERMDKLQEVVAQGQENARKSQEIIERAKIAAEQLKRPTFATPATPDYLENIPQPLTQDRPGATQELKDKIGFEAPPLYIKPASDEVQE